MKKGAANVPDASKRDFDFPELRKKAEQIVGQPQEAGLEKDDSDLVRLNNELTVYQMELELQNQELRRTAKDLETARNEWFELFDAAPVGFLLLNTSGVIERCNQAAARLLTGSRHPMSGRSILPRIHPDDRYIYYSLARSMAAYAGSASSRELRLVRENGEIIHVHIEASAVKDPEGNFSQWRLALVDISERKNHENALRKVRYELEDRVQERTVELHTRNRQLAWLTSELIMTEQRERKRLAQVLHDHLQQLLVGVRLHLEILSGETGMEDKPAYRKVYDLVTDAIEASRSLSSELLPPVLFQKELPEALRWLVQWMTETHRLEVALDLPDDFPFLREELRVPLFYTIRELLFNVVKHAKTSNARVAVQEKNGGLRITVSDQGRGCDPERLASEGQGAGFGLFAIRERLEFLGGNLEVSCAPDAGFTATIFLPIESPTYEQPEHCPPIPDQFREAPEPSAKKLSASSDKIRVMLVDDHSLTREGLFSLLSASGDIEIVGEAANGEGAMEQARRFSPDVILMDINMPGMNGVEATRRIHTEMPDIRIYGLSMNAAEDQAHAMFEAGAAGYLSKCGSTDAVLAAIRGKEQNTRP